MMVIKHHAPQDRLYNTDEVQRGGGVKKHQDLEDIV